MFYVTLQWQARNTDYYLRDINDFSHYLIELCKTHKDLSGKARILQTEAGVMDNMKHQKIKFEACNSTQIQ